MSAGIRKEIQLEIAHVLFIDIVGYQRVNFAGVDAHKQPDVPLKG
jgi:hypothetical protein